MSIRDNVLRIQDLIAESAKKAGRNPAASLGMKVIPV